jgi:DNA-directed RNA polymerase subunit RPC12/RpoP
MTGTMTLKSGEQTACDAELECMNCHVPTFVIQGHRVPRCPGCYARVFRKVRELARRMIFLSTVGSPGAPMNETEA